MLRPIAVTAWLAAACGFKINQMASDLRTVVVGFWVSKWFWWSEKAWKNSLRVINEKDLKKKPAWSCIEAKGMIHGFVSAVDHTVK